MESSNKSVFWDKLKKEDNVYFVLCSTLAFSIILFPFLNSAIAFGFLFYWLFFSKKNFSFKNINTKWCILFCSLFLIVLLGMLYTSDIRQGISRIEKKAPLFIFPLIFSSTTGISSIAYKKTQKLFIIATGIGCLICMANGIYFYLKYSETSQLFGYSLIVLKQMSPAIMSFCCLLSLLFSFQNFYEMKILKKEIRLWVLPIIFSIIIFTFLLLLGNRIAIAVTILLSIIYIFKLIPGKRYRIVAFISFFAIIFTSVIVNPSLHNQINDLKDFSKNNTIALDQDASLGRSWGGKALRFAIWECSWDVIKNNWLLGVGTGDAQNSLQDVYERRKFYFASRYNRYDAHNQYLQQLVSNGIVGLLVFFCCISIPLIYHIKQKQKLLYCLFLLCFAIACITESMLEVSKGVIIYSFFNSLLLFKYQPNFVV